MLFVKNNPLCVRKCWMSWRKPQSFMSIIMFTSKVYLSGECSKRQAEGRNICICSQMSRDAWGLMWGCDKCGDMGQLWPSERNNCGVGMLTHSSNNSQKVCSNNSMNGRQMSRVREVCSCGWHFTLTAHSFLLQQFYWSQVISRRAKTAAEEISSQLI